MFQFGGFPSYTYVFSIWYMVLHHVSFLIRKSAGRSLFAAHRSLSQLVTSFIGSLCQGIHLMLLFAWTFLTFQFSSFELLEFLNKYFSVINSSVKRFYPFCFLNLLHLSVKLYFTQIFRKDLLEFDLTNLNLNPFCLCPLICSFLLFNILYSVFNEHIHKLYYRLCVKFISSAKRLRPSGTINLRSLSFVKIRFGGLKWTRTTDLALIRRAL